MSYAELSQGFLVLAFAVLFGIEVPHPNFRYRNAWLWYAHAILFLVTGTALSIGIGEVVGAWLPTLQASRFLPALPAPLMGLIAYLFVSFFVYWWHRARHASPLLWSCFHQIHHSTHRLQAMTAFYAHPLDYLGNALIVTLVAYALLGLDTASAAWASAWVGVFEIWERTNLAAPVWLGYFIMRPEMHRIHHELNRHQGNYGIPLWDWLFGTYENSQRVVACGFAPEREGRLMERLLLEDVHVDDRRR